MALEKLHFEASTGEKIDVGFMQDLLPFKKAKALRKKYKDDVEELSDAFMEATLDKATIEKIENLSIRDYSAFMTGWTESEDGSDVSLGES